MADNMKDLRNKYGVSMKPIPCTRAWVRDMPFDHGNVKTRSYILVNDTVTPPTRVHVNTYNGEARAGFDVTKATHPISDEKELTKKLKGYTPCGIADCPVAVDANAPQGI